MSKRHEEAGEEGEAWLMSYADLITLLLAVFVLLFSIASVDKEKAAVVTKSISHYMNTKEVEENVVSDITIQERQIQTLRRLTNLLDLGHPDEVNARILEISKNPSEVEKLRALAERMGLYGNATISAHALRFEIVVPENLAFEPNSAFLTKRGVKVVRDIIPALKEAVGKAGKSIQVEGHTDSVPPPADSSFSSNHILSAARAEAVSLFLTSSGISPAKIRIVGKANSEPLYPEDGTVMDAETARRRNRRVVIAVLTDEAMVENRK
jgi:chemotaxis protein MotB